MIVPLRIAIGRSDAPESFSLDELDWRMSPAPSYFVEVSWYDPATDRRERLRLRTVVPVDAPATHDDLGYRAIMVGIGGEDVEYLRRLRDQIDRLLEGQG